MARLNKSFIDNLKTEFEITRFSASDFDFSFPSSGSALVTITFKYDDSFSFKLSEEIEYDIITEKDRITLGIGTREQKNKRTVEYAAYSPGKYKKTDKIELYDIGSASSEIRSWCDNIFREITLTNISDSSFEEFRKNLEEQLSSDIPDENSIATDEELAALNDKFDTILANFEQLKEKNQITEEAVSNLRSELDLLKSSAKSMPKGIWAKVAKNKLVDFCVKFAKSKEGKDLLLTGVKKLIFGQ